MNERTPSEPTAEDIAEREAIAKQYFDPEAAKAAHDAYMKRMGRCCGGKCSQKKEQQ